MTIPNYDAKYDDLSEIASDPRYMRLCVQQMRELTKLNSKFATERVRLGLAIKKEMQDNAE